MSLSRPAVLLGAALAAACASGAGPAVPPPPLRVATAPELLGLDPHRQKAHGGLSMLGNVYEGLTTFDAEMGVVPALAVRWESADELTWRFHLRPGVAFHDGRPLTAADVVASLERARRPGHTSHGALSTVSAIVAPAPDVVEIRTERPNPMLLNNLVTAFVLPRDAPAEVTAPVGTGPYRFVAFDPSRGLDLEAWDNHWAGAPPARRLSFVFEPDPGRRLGRLASGAVDVALRLDETAEERPGSGYRLVSRLAPGIRVLGLRVDGPPFADPRIRRAVHLAIDREALTRTLLLGRGRPAGQPLPPAIFGHVPDLRAPARDLPAARRLVEEATRGRGLDVTIDHGPGRQREAEAVAAQLAEAGLRVNLHLRDVPALMTSLGKGEARAVLFSYVYTAGDAVDVFENILHRRDPSRDYGAENIFGYRNPRVDALIEAGASARSMSVRLADYQSAIRLVMEDLPLVPLWEVPWVYGVRDGVEWTPGASGWFVAAQARRSAP